MPGVSNLDLFRELKSIKESYEDKFTKLNKFVIGRCVHFEQENKILAIESKMLKSQLEDMCLKYNEICEELSVTKTEMLE